jgi:ABC-2 type transport system ATP-binding protein
MIEVENLTKKYGNVAAVKGVTFKAVPGQVTGFLGPNGAGKTTTMRMLTGFMPPTSGKATVAGFDVFEQSMEVRKRVGYLPENVPLYRDMTARGYLLYVADIRGLKQARQRADDALERVRLLDRADSRIRTLSKGMRQRVGLASAIIHDPDVLILDEPTIGLDPFQVLELRELVRELGRRHTLLFSTHILSEAEQVCDNVIIMRQGEVVAAGSPTGLREQLERGGRLLVRLANAPDSALTQLSALSGIAHVERGIDGSLVITPTSASADPRQQIATLAVQQGWGLTELRPLAVNLEEIFLEVTAAESRTGEHGTEHADAVGATHASPLQTGSPAQAASPLHDASPLQTGSPAQAASPQPDTLPTETPSATDKEN